MAIISAPFDPPDLRAVKVGTEHEDHHGFAMLFRRDGSTAHRCSCGGDIDGLFRTAVALAVGTDPPDRPQALP